YPNESSLRSQSSGPTNLVADETVYKEWEDRMERATTTASRLEAEQDGEAQTRFEAASKQSNDPPLSRVHTLGSREVSKACCCIIIEERVNGVSKGEKVNGQEQIQALVDKQKKLTFYKAFFSPQWKFLIHTILQCLSAKTTAWNEFSSTMASAIICLANNQKFIFSKYIFDQMVKHLEGGVKFLIFLRYLQVFLDKQGEGIAKHKEIYVISSHTKKVFANMRRQGYGFSGNVTPLFETMMVNAQEEIKPKRKQRQTTEVHSPSSKIPVEESIPTPSNDLLPSGEDSIQLNELMIFCTNLQQQVLDLEEAKTSQAKEIANLKKRVKKQEKRRKSRPAVLRRLKKVGSSNRVESSDEKDSLGALEDASKQGRSIQDIDQDAEIALVDEAQGRMHDAYIFGVDGLEGNEVFVDAKEKIVEKEVSTVDPVTTAGEVVIAASVEDSAAPTTAATADVDDELTLAKTLIAIKAAKPKVISTAATIITSAITTPRAKEPEKPLKKKDQITLDEVVARRYCFYEQVQAHIAIVSSSKDKVKENMIEPEKPLKKKDQITLDEVVARRLEAEMKAEMKVEERIAREKDEANRTVIEECDDVHATIDVDRQLAK
nr:hypothetical protein [Tanacetum cinerariifolium]